MASFPTDKIGILKLLELLIVCCCVGLHDNSYDMDKDYAFVGTGTYVGYLIIMVGVYGGLVFSESISKKIDLYFSIVGCALFIASGAMAIDTFKDGSGETHDIGLAKGALAIINAIFFLIDAYFTYKN